MNINLDLDLLLYGMILSGFGVLSHRLAPELGTATLATGIVGGVLVAFWGVLGLSGVRRRIWPIGTLIVLDLVLMVQAAKVWLLVTGGDIALKPVALILTLLLVFGIGQVVNFVQWSASEK